MATTLTSHLLALDQPAFTAATQSPFLAAAGAGRIPKSTLGRWLANDRLYIHAYIKAAGRALATITLPQTTSTTTTGSPSPETQLVDWLLTTLTELRREERLFIDVAERFGLLIDLETETMKEAGRNVQRVPTSAKNAGLVMFERLFNLLSVRPAPSSLDRETPLPWLEAAVVFWGTERVYLEAWTWAKGKQTGRRRGSGGEDEDGGALRKEFIPNWSNEGFRAFVEQLGVIVDGAVEDTVNALGEGVRPGLLQRAENVWRELLAAETAFWPDAE